MSTQAAFQRGLQPMLKLLLVGKAKQVLAVRLDKPLRDRIEELAGKSTEGELSPAESAEYEGYVRANKFAAVLRRQAKLLTTGK